MKKLFCVGAMLIGWVAGAILSGCQTQTAPPKIGMLGTAGFLKHWEAPMDLRKDPITQLFVRGKVVAMYTEGNLVYFLDADSGSPLGTDRITAQGLTVHPPVELTDYIAIPTTGTVELFDKAGHKISSLSSLRPIQSHGAGLANSLFVGVNFGTTARLARFDVSRTRLFLFGERYTTAMLQGAPATFGDDVYAGGTDGKVWAYTSSNVQAWNTTERYGVFQTGAPITADLAADEAGVYIASQDRKLYCLDRTNGRMKWSYYADLPLLDAPVVFGDFVYQIVPNRGVVAINKNEGNFTRDATWIYPSGAQILSADEKYVYVRTGRSTITALDRTTGKPAFQSTRGDLAVFATNLKTPIIYAATKTGTVVAVRPVTKPGETGEMVMTPVQGESISVASRE